MAGTTAQQSTTQLFLSAGSALATLSSCLAELAERNECQVHAETRSRLTDEGSSEEGTLSCNQQVISECHGSEEVEPDFPKAFSMGRKTTVRCGNDTEEQRDVTQSLQETWVSCDTQHAEATLRRVSLQLGSRDSQEQQVQSVLAAQPQIQQDTSNEDSRATAFWSSLGFIVHPQSFQRLVWDTISVLFVIHGFIVLPLAAFSLPSIVWVEAIEWTNAIFWTLDVLMCFRTGYLIGAKLEMRPINIALHYCKTWFVPDVCIVVAEWLSMSSGDLNSLSAGRVNRIFRMLRFLRFFRAVKLWNQIKMIETAMTSSVRMLGFSIVKMAVLLLLAVHFLSCGWFATGSMDAGWVSKSKPEYVDTFGNQYLSSYRWTLAQINGRTDQVEDRTELEKLYTCLCALFTILIMSLLVSSITARMTQLRGIRDEQMKYMRVLNAYLDKNHVSWTTAFFVRQHAKKMHEVQSHTEDEPKALELLPSQLQGELLFEVRSPLLLGHPFFKYISEISCSVQSLCARAIRPHTAHSLEAVFERGFDSKFMMFVEKGELVYSGHDDFKAQLRQWHDDAVQRQSDSFHAMMTVDTPMSLRCHVPEGYEVKPGMWLCEAALWLKWRHAGELVATGNCQYLRVDATKFAEVVHGYPEVSSLSALYARAFREMMVDASDLLTDLPLPDIEMFCLQYMAKQDRPLECGAIMSISRNSLHRVSL